MRDRHPPDAADGSNPDHSPPGRSTTPERPLYRRLQDRLRVFNKHVLNRLTRGFAGRPYVPYGLVRHVGRRSGRTYDTPVLAGTTEDRVFVPLIYGADTDWCRNVRATGECTVAWQGRAFEATSPRLVEPGAASGAFPGWFRRATTVAGAEQYLALDRGEAVPGEYRAVVEDHPAWPVALGVVGVVALVALLWWVATAGA